MSRAFSTLGAVLVGLSVGGCSSLFDKPVFLGPSFAEVKAPEGGAVIYIYRNPIGRFRNIKMPVYVDMESIGDFYAGGYVPYRVKAGSHKVQLMMGKDQVVVLDAKPGSASFVRLTIRQVYDESIIEYVPPQEARAEIAECSLLPGGYDHSDAF